MSGGPWLSEDRRRSDHSDTLLLDGRVLLSGGLTGDYSATLDQTDIFDPGTNTFTAGPTFEGRFLHTSAFLQASSLTALASSANPSAAGQPVTFTATVTVSKPSELSGKVTFYDSSEVLGSAQLQTPRRLSPLRSSQGRIPFELCLPATTRMGRVPRRLWFSKSTHSHIHDLVVQPQILRNTARW